jgi:hypothetical protein
MSLTISKCGHVSSCSVPGKVSVFVYNLSLDMDSDYDYCISFPVAIHCPRKRVQANPAWSPLFIYFLEHQKSQCLKGMDDPKLHVWHLFVPC